MKQTTHANTGQGLLGRLLLGSFLLGVLSSFAGTAWADETEIFRASIDNSGSRPKVLIVFDDSGSMSTVAEYKAAYKSTTNYATVGAIQGGRLYWATGSDGDPPPPSTNQWFDASKNRCAYGANTLSKQGVYVDKWSSWNTSASTAWSDSLSVDAQNAIHVDCSDDIDERDSGNGSGQSDGYPCNSAGGYCTSRNRSVDDSWKTYRVYTANYMNWFHGTGTSAYPGTGAVSRSRLDVAQTVVNNIIDGNPGIDFGLAVFNSNSTTANDGGRIVRRIVNNGSAADRQDLMDVVSGFSADGSTPICESMYEAYLYLAGQRVNYGNNASSSDKPGKDSLAEKSGIYISPSENCQYVYIILVTDGEPQRDISANNLIKSLTKKTCKKYLDADKDMTENCLPELAEYMYTQDFDGKSNNGVQKAITYTIGFTTDQTLLSDAAAKGGGKYFTTKSAEGLTSAFQGAITDILSTSSSFTSPAVAVDSFSRTQSLDSVFLAMFLPRETTDWPGNIKKFKVTVNTSGVASYVDADGFPALDTATGQLKSTAKSFWGTVADGADVTKGGVGALLVASNLDNRVIKYNTASGSLADFTTAGVTATNFGVANNTALFNAFGVTSQTELNNLLAWIRGWTDSGKTAKRTWIMGDILNSRPVAINYGARGTYTKTNPDLRLLVGTNAGLLHMFSGDTGAESWAFAPRELAALHAQRRTDAESADTLYGVDAPPVIYRLDANNDGSIKSADGDKVYAFVGLRRGGRVMYALDLTNPDSPSFMWKIDTTTTGFEELGQTWSTPTVTRIKGYSNPVLVFGAGYDTSFDDKTTLASGTTASMGRGVYLVDAVTGSLLWSATPRLASATNKQVAAFTRPMAAPPTVMDSNGDGFADRIYIPDVGGNIWRIDLAGTGIPSTDHTAWRVLQLATLAETNHAGDRRFFNAIEVARALESAKPFDALMIGSGDRTNPNATDNADRFYMIRDYMTGVYTTDRPTTADCTSNPASDPRCQLPVMNSTLYNASDNLIQVGSEAEKVAAKNSLGTAAGWYVNLTAASGEKSLATSRTISGTVYFPTFSPGGSALNANQCVPAAGTGRLYAVNIFDASAKLDFDGSNTLTLSDRSVVTGSMISDTPSIYSGSDRVIQLILPPGSVPTTGTIFRQGSQSTGRRLGLQTRVPFVPTETYTPGQDAGRYWYRPDRR